MYAQSALSKPTLIFDAASDGEGSEARRWDRDPSASAKSQRCAALVGVRGILPTWAFPPRFPLPAGTPICRWAFSVYLIKSKNHPELHANFFFSAFGQQSFTVEHDDSRWRVGTIFMRRETLNTWPLMSRGEN